MKSLIPLGAITCIVLGGASLSSATTVYFLPGDAYFRSTISDAWLESITKGQPITFSYQPTAEYFCGFAGTARLRFADKEGKLLEQLKQAYAVIRKRYPQRGIMQQRYQTVELEDGGFRIEKKGKAHFVETNELHVFIYNADFDFDQHRLLHLYNENWKQESYGVHKEPNELIGTKDVLQESLKNARVVPPLKVTRQGSPKEAAHLVPAGELQFVIVPLDVWLEPVAGMKLPQQKPELRTPEEFRDNPGVGVPPDIYILKSDGLYKRSFKNGEWSPELKLTYEELKKTATPGFF